MPELTSSVAVGSPTALLTDVSLQLPANQLGLIYGRSGAGKTTLLQLLAGLTDTTSGRISLGSGATQTIRTCCCSVAYCCSQLAAEHLCMFALLLLLVLMYNACCAWGLLATDVNPTCMRSTLNAQTITAEASRYHGNPTRALLTLSMHALVVIDYCYCRYPEWSSGSCRLCATECNDGAGAGKAMWARLPISRALLSGGHFARGSILEGFTQRQLPWDTCTYDRLPSADSDDNVLLHDQPMHVYSLQSTQSFGLPKER